ncbi:MAG: hypothetical protein J1F35_01470 [Erysipelotrichales bacterium]|nr:hypothetical protein [Erysipelotrichales bacterium]
MDLNKIIRNLLMRFPLFGNVIANLEFIYTTKAVNAPAFTDGSRVYYKQEFIDNYSDAEREFIIAHEILHIVFSHVFRNTGRDQDLLNYVADAIINKILVNAGMTMPEGLVYIEDALDYSVDELYLKYLPKIVEIKKLMDQITYHIDLSELDELIEQMYKNDLNELMDENESIKRTMLGDFENDLQKKAFAGTASLGFEFPSVNVGRSDALLSWRDLLCACIVTPDASTVSFYEIEMDGIIRKEYKSDESNAESEVIIDTSSSMPMKKIKVILRECKNILQTSDLKVGFCDVEFYGWNDIKTEEDIDNLKITGRGGTNFYVMAKSFSSTALNRIVITDGGGAYPLNYPGVLWIILNTHIPTPPPEGIDYIFINENDISAPNNSKELVLNGIKK